MNWCYPARASIEYYFTGLRNGEQTQAKKTIKELVDTIVTIYTFCLNTDIQLRCCEDTDDSLCFQLSGPCCAVSLCMTGIYGQCYARYPDVGHVKAHYCCRCAKQREV